MAQANESSSSVAEQNNQSHNTTAILPPWAQALTAQAADIGIKYVAYQQFSSTVGIVDSAVGLLSAPNIDNEQCITNFVQFQKLNETVLPNECLMKQCGVPVDQMVNLTAKMNPNATETFRQDMLEGLANLKSQMANNYIYTSAVVSVGLIVLQICKLINVWKEIKVAENLHNDPMKFAAIEQNIEEFRKMCTRLEDLITNKKVDDIILDTIDLNEKYTETILLINKLEVKIGRVMQHLELSADGQLYDALSNTLMGANNIVQLFALFQLASSPAKIIGSTIVAAFGLLVTANVVTYHITQKRLTELRSDIQNLQKLQLQVQKINAGIKSVLRDYRHRRT
ncbi:unnamed protein product [Rotaria magnacalcarata]|uniref:Uncharacterized protein n=1 Tax=Rotaria magnacalcarata TaxID=392030 RepID=A0A815WZM5_9BILA|nr:unnamed protein product [Rotaria magnacalcarata]CAF1549988.1 unnamed protein product [Rotaria magnacalcarata]CAF2115877.1 unnamed protein product [Rotaria magnacalcarata]CAF3970637.1 unnamed protein product [Rotaria magnacalcarata]CAF4007181.1 unnamed protein product [Rotaria magnacalcarata]